MTGSRRRAGRCWRSPSPAPGCWRGTSSGRCRSRCSPATGACSLPRLRSRVCSSSTRSRRCSRRCHEHGLATAGRGARRAPAGLAAPAGAGAGRVRSHTAHRVHSAGARRPAAGDRHRQRRGAPDPRQPPAGRGPAHVALLHGPRLQEPVCRTGPLRAHHARCGVRQRNPRSAQRTRADLPGGHRSGGAWAPCGPRRLVSAAEGGRPAPLPLRLLRLDQGREALSAMNAAASTPPAASVGLEGADGPGARLPRWWPLAAITLLAAALRLSTLGLQSFWYDEAFTPVHVLHPSLWATLRSVVHTENTPPLWYVLAWADSRVMGTGAIALRLPSALAGIATVPVAWAISRELASRRAAILFAAIVAVNPLFVWYSQEARAYGLFVLLAAMAMLCFLRAEGDPTPRHMAAFALSGAAALLTHYFAVFLLIPMVLWLLRGWSARSSASRRAALSAIGALVLVGLALLPLISAQGGHGTQWIGRWPISERLQAIPQYFLTGYSGAPLGHGVELLVALVVLSGLGLGAWRILAAPAGTASEEAPAPALATANKECAPDADTERERRRERERCSGARRGALIALAIAAGGVLTPIVLAGLGAR